jgi:acetyl-CoA acetyltransferase
VSLDRQADSTLPGANGQDWLARDRHHAARTQRAGRSLGTATCKYLSNRVFVIGVGMTKFEKPGRRADWDYPQMAREAGTKALADAGVGYDAIQQAYFGYVYGESCSGHRAAYELGLTGIPIFNVNSNCSTGSSALYLATEAIRSGQGNVTLALGFEKMQPGSLGSTFNDRENPMAQHMDVLVRQQHFVIMLRYSPGCADGR